MNVDLIFIEQIKIKAMFIIQYTQRYIRKLPYKNMFTTTPLIQIQMFY